MSRAKREPRDIELGSNLRRLFKISSGLSGQLLSIVAGTRHRTKKSRYFGLRDGDRSAGSLPFAKQGAHVTGVDISTGQIEAAKTLASQKKLNVRFIVAKAEDRRDSPTNHLTL